MGNGTLEIVRFGLYLSIPVIATYIYAQPDMIQKIIENRKYIIYPPQATTREELETMVILRKKQKDNENINKK